MSEDTPRVKPEGLGNNVHIFEIHPHWKHGKCRECGQLWWVHRDVQRGVEPAETCCPGCNEYYKPNWSTDVAVRL